MLEQARDMNQFVESLRRLYQDGKISKEKVVELAKMTNPDGSARFNAQEIEFLFSFVMRFLLNSQSNLSHLPVETTALSFAAV